jgi:hypothetical protein
MKRARLGGLVLLATIIALLLSSQASALDHPWDDNKYTDTTHLSAGGSLGTKNTNGNNGQNDGSGSFWDWLIRLFHDPVEEPEEDRSDSRVKDKAQNSKVDRQKSSGLITKLKL